MAIEQEIIYNAITLSIPALSVLSNTIGGTGFILQILDPVSIGVGNYLSAIGGSLSITIYKIWVWILYNLLTPLILVSYLALFFVGQYFLIKAYIFILKNGVAKSISIYSLLIQNKTLDNTINKVFTSFSK